MRILIFGIDGLAFRVLQPMMEHGYLPNFQALAHDGVEAILESKYPPLTPPAWMSLSTGLKPAKHGTYDFWEYDEQGNSRLVSKRKAGKAIWNILSDYGKRVIVMNVPHTYPPDPVNGIMVSGIPGSEKADFVYPKSFRDQLLAHIPSYQVDGNYNKVQQGRLTHVQAAIELNHSRIALMRYLLEQQEWDFAFITFCAADYLQHWVWEDIMRLEPNVIQYYQMLDEALGLARTAVGSDGVLFVVSDHGFQGARTRFAINEYLLRRKWLRTSRPLNRHNGIIHAVGKQILGQFNLLEYGRILKYRFFVSPDQSKLGKEAPYLTWQEQREAGVSVASLSSSAAGFADICISRPMSEQEMADLRGELLELTDPVTGWKLVDALYGTEAFGQGPFQPKDEHLLLLPSEGYTFTPVLGRPWLWERERHLFGTHQKDGVLYACGPNIKADAREPTTEIYNVMPTVLQLMGIPLPNDLDGHTIDDLFVTPLSQTEKRNEEEQLVVAQKLKKLLKS